MRDPSAQHPVEDPSTNELLDEYSLQDVLEPPTEEVDISGLPIDEFIEPVLCRSAETEALLSENINQALNRT